MWIFLSTVAFIALLIFAILMLPVRVIINTTPDGDIDFRYKLLFKTFGEDPNPDDPILKTLKDISGVSRLDKENRKENTKKSNALRTLSDSVSVILGLLKHLLSLLKYCTVKKLKIKIVCAEGDAAETAIEFGRCYAIISPLVNFLHSSMKVKKRGEQIDIFCDFEKEEGYYEFETILMVRLHRVLGALFRAAYDEHKRSAENNN